jgi:hypothetical protein
MSLELHCDLDDVIVDCVRASLLANGRADLANDPTFPPTYNISTDVGMSYQDFWGKVDSLGSDWWLQIPFTSFGRGLLDYLLSLEVPVSITSRVISANGCHGKWRWWEQHIPSRVPLHLTTDKSKFAGVGNLLIDDSPTNIDKWTAKGGCGILVPAPYNENKHLIGRELSYIIPRVERFIGGK